MRSVWGHDGGRLRGGVGAFDDHAPFHLGESCHDAKEEFATCGGGVESFCEETEGNAAFTEVVDGVDDMADGPSEAIEFPHDENIAVILA